MIDFILRPGTSAWRHGVGYEFFPEGAHLKGELVRVNDQKRIAIIRSKTSQFTVNIEDLEQPPVSDLARPR